MWLVDRIWILGTPRRREGEMPEVLMNEWTTHDEVVLALGKEAVPR
jgi:hypothetical protein